MRGLANPRRRGRQDDRHGCARQARGRLRLRRPVQRADRRPQQPGHLNRSSRPPGRPPASHQRAPQARRRLVRVRLRQTITQSGPSADRRLRARYPLPSSSLSVTPSAGPDRRLRTVRLPRGTAVAPDVRRYLKASVSLLGHIPPELARPTRSDEDVLRSAPTYGVLATSACNVAEPGRRNAVIPPQSCRLLAAVDAVLCTAKESCRQALVDDGITALAAGRHSAGCR
jgi:hypothetical protein